MEDGSLCYIEGVSKQHEWSNWEEFMVKYEHPIWQEYLSDGIKTGHGGIDYLVLRSYVEAVKNNTNTPIDVYDFATWAAITPLSENSIATGSSAVSFPDFTKGYFIHPRPAVQGKYCLDI